MMKAFLVLSFFVAVAYGQQRADQTIGNLSLRGAINDTSQLITGFVIQGSSPTAVLIRGAGPALLAYGVTNAVKSPVLRLFNSRGEKIDENVGWGNRPAAELGAIGRLGKTFPFAGNSADCGMWVMLQPGLYTAQLSGAANSSGIGLIELYQEEGLGTVPRDQPHFINASSRCVVGSDEAVAIAGTNLPKNRRILIRAIGPSLAPFGVSGALLDPKMEIVRPPLATGLHGGIVVSPAVLVTENNDWEDQVPLKMGANSDGTLRPIVGVSWSGSAEEIRRAAAKCGAFPIAQGSKDAAMLVVIDWNPMTINVRGADGGSGVVLIEIYDVEGL